LGYEELKTATKKSAKKTATKATKKQAPRRGNPEGQKWTDEGISMTLRLPAETELELRKYALTKGDLTLIVLFALDHVNLKDLDIVKTRKTGLGLGRPMILHLGTKVRNDLRNWAESKKASINSIVLSVLENFFERVRSKPKLDEELRMELRARRGI
jgi:hypothetical protein